MSEFFEFFEINDIHIFYILNMHLLMNIIFLLNNTIPKNKNTSEKKNEKTGLF